jgi:hypothetical protein
MIALIVPPVPLLPSTFKVLVQNVLSCSYRVSIKIAYPKCLQQYMVHVLCIEVNLSTSVQTKVCHKLPLLVTVLNDDSNININIFLFPHVFLL